MAEGSGKDEPSFPSQRRISSSSEDEDYVPTEAGRPDLGIPGHPASHGDRKHSTGPDLPRREENPFSFKHFLKNDSQTNYQHTGARPKVYSPSTNSPEPTGLETEMYPRNPTELPDFVQDHLVIEQCYLNHEATMQPILDMENLPDFALNSMEQRQPRQWSEPKKCQSEILGDLPFDLTGSLDRGRRERSTPNVAPPGPLDLPTFDRPDNEPIHRLGSIGFPFDLQLPIAESDPNSSGGGARNCPPTGETNVTKSLPDFLSDGPIHNRAAGPSIDSGPSPSSPEPANQRLMSDNERLRRELEVTQRQLGEQSRRIQSLESELASRRAVDHEETAHLEKAMEQVEDNLKRSTRRAVNAESTVTALKQEIKVLTAEILAMRLENRELRMGMGAGCSSGTRSPDRRIRRVANDLRAAASTAEISLRQLMSGVDNLRVLASALENVDRIEDRTKDFLPDFDDDNAAGPAL